MHHGPLIFYPLVFIVVDTSAIASPGGTPTKAKDGLGDANIKLYAVVNLLLDFGTFLSRAKGDIESAMKLYRKAIEVMNICRLIIITQFLIIPHL